MNILISILILITCTRIIYCSVAMPRTRSFTRNMRQVISPIGRDGQTGRRTAMTRQQLTEAQEKLYQVRRELQRVIDGCQFDEPDGAPSVLCQHLAATLPTPILSPAQSDDEEMDEDFPFLHKSLFNSTNDSTDGHTVMRATMDSVGVNVIANSTGETVLSVDSSNVDSKLVLCDKSVILFTGYNIPQTRLDILNSLVLAQLAADKAVQKKEIEIARQLTGQEKIEEWSLMYKTALNNFRWTTLTHDTDKIHLKGNDFNMEKILMDTIGEMCQDGDKDRLRQALTVLKTLPAEDDKIRLFKRRTMTRDMTSVSVNMVHIDSLGNAVMKMSTFYIGTTQDVTNVLWFNWSDEKTQVWKSKQTMMFSPQLYDKLRPMVDKKILQLNETFINSIDM